MIEKLVVGPMNTNSYIYTDEDTGACYLVDPGGDEDKILDALERMKTGPKQPRPKGILLTHGHLDHISSVADLYGHFKMSDPDFHLGIHEEDREYLGRAAEKTHKRSFTHLGIMGTEYFKAYFSETPEPDVLFSDGDAVPECGLKVILTPGHTPGKYLPLQRGGKDPYLRRHPLRRGYRTDRPSRGRRRRHRAEYPGKALCTARRCQGLSRARARDEYRRGKTE